MPKILVVDDDLDILVVMEILLTMKGFEVDVTPKWETTFDRIESFKPDLILLDVLISGNDGRILCKKLKSETLTRKIPIIMFSAHPGAAATINQYGADDFIAKPFDVNDLLAKVDKQLPIKNFNKKSAANVSK
jgi:DNA-binding response OmpR family regulator